MPQAVQTDKDDYKAVIYAKIITLLVEGMKEQQKQIDELKKKISGESLAQHSPCYKEINLSSTAGPTALRKSFVKKLMKKKMNS